MKDKDIIQETLKKFVDYKVKTPYDLLFNIFREEFENQNTKLNKYEKSTLHRTKYALNYLFLMGLAALLAPFPYNMCSEAVIIILIFIISTTAECLIIKRKHTLINNMDEYAEFITNLYLNHNPDYYDTNINSSNWKYFLRRCHYYSSFMIS